MVINLGRKKTPRRVLYCIGIPHTSTEPIRTLRSLLVQHRRTSFANAQSNPQRARNLRSEDSVTTLSDIANAWPQRIPHADKAHIAHDFHAATSSNVLKTVTCAACAENVRVRDTSNQILISTSFVACAPCPSLPIRPMQFHAYGNEDGALSLSLCFPYRNALSRGKLPRFALANLNVIGALPPELQSLTLVEEFNISRCRAKLCIVPQDYNDDVPHNRFQLHVPGSAACRPYALCTPWLVACQSATACRPPHHFPGFIPLPPIAAVSTFTRPPYSPYRPTTPKHGDYAATHGGR